MPQYCLNGSLIILPLGCSLERNFMSHMMLEINSCLWKTECTKYEWNGELDSEFRGSLGKESRILGDGNYSRQLQIVRLI